MNIAILGYGKEGKAVESYFKSKTNEVKIFNNFTIKELKNQNFKNFDMVFRSPSVPPFDSNWSSSTKYFFDNCICPIIGVTGTKGKGTTCSIITDLLKNLGKKVHLVGNIGNPAIEILDKIQPEDVVVYEMSSFQLWDLSISPKISVILRIEPDHLNVHKDYSDYLEAKSHICLYQTNTDSCIYFKDNIDSAKIAEKSQAKKYPYPINKKSDLLKSLLSSLSIPGAHNRENAEAALLAVSAYFETDLENFIKFNSPVIEKTFKNFRGLPHRLEYIKTINNIKYYDDNFSTTVPSLEVAINSFSDKNLVLIVGGRDKTSNADIPKINNLLSSPNIKKVILIGESGHEIYNNYKNKKYIISESLADAVKKAKTSAETSQSEIVLMSPAAASFDMFENVYDRGEKFQNLIKDLK